jgi:GT2 family glycosyltransferase
MNQTHPYPQVSVIIPLYNKEKYIARAINSVLNQTHKNFEVIIVDDGSTDQGPYIVSSIQDPRVTLLRQKNRGPGAARNLGIKMSRGHLVAFLDADDEWLPDYLNIAVDILEHREDLAAVSQGLRLIGAVNSSPRIFRKMYFTDGVHEMNQASDPRLAARLLSFMSPCSTVIKKESVIVCGGFYEGSKCLYGEDEHLFLKILLNYKIFILLSQKAIYYLEASDLTQRHRGPHPVEPFLLSPSAIEMGCPVEKKALLKKILAIRALRTADIYAIHGHRQMSKQLIHTFAIPGFMPFATAQSKVLCCLSPALPFFYRLYRSAKRLVFSDYVDIRKKFIPASGRPPRGL